jgi:hypothetical protein
VECSAVNTMAVLTAKGAAAESDQGKAAVNNNSAVQCSAQQQDRAVLRR